MRTSISLRTRFNLLKRDRFRCQYCGAHAGSTELVVDHVIPASKGGPDEPWNLLTACNNCNQGKAADYADVSLLWALSCAKSRDDKSAGYRLFCVLTSRGWSSEEMLAAAGQIFEA